MAKQINITVESESLLIVRASSSRRGWCDVCAAHVEMIATEETAVITNLDQPQLDGWLNSEELHRSTAPDDSTLICLNSLLSRIQSHLLSGIAGFKDRHPKTNPKDTI